MRKTTKPSVRCVALVVTAVLFCGCLAAVAGAEVLVLHVGQNDPATEGMELASTGGSAAPGNDGEDHWAITAPTSKYLAYNGWFDGAELDDPNGWTATIRVRAIISADFSQTALDVRGSELKYTMRLSDGTGIYPRGLYTLNSSGVYEFLFDSDVTQYRTYQMVFDPVTDNTVISFYVDGWLKAQKDATDFYTEAGDPRLRWGDQRASSGASNNHWALVKLETGVNIVPEPSIWMLLLLGGLALAAFRRR